MKNRIFMILAFLVLAIAHTANGAALSGTNLVHSAEVFAAGKTYKLTPNAQDRADGKYDCTTFVQAVLDKSGLQVGGDTGNKININVPGVTTNNLKSLVLAKDSKIQGVVTALLDSSQGSKVESLAELKAGDIIQMWKISGNKANGHVGIVKSVDTAESKVVLVGAHTSGVGAKEFSLGESGWSIWFAVRPK